MPRVQFMSMCEQLYDHLEETPRLQHTLREQIRKSTALLQTLQASGQMIEGLVRSHFREMQVAYGEKFGAAVTDLHRRIVRIEEGAGIVPPGTPAPFGSSGGLRSAGVNGAPGGGFGGKLGSGCGSGTVENMLAGIVDRLEALEKKSGGE
ncbi:hypothetical protein HDV00_008101 [Rhizophlyctis rosea]|nr:hypothetical protein HDV00_008101 [Rhizophlyctis rosea]